MCQSLDEDVEAQELEQAIRLSLQEQRLAPDTDCSPQLVSTVLCRMRPDIWTRFFGSLNFPHLLSARMSRFDSC
jgi:hypothetical protein